MESPVKDNVETSVISGITHNEHRIQLIQEAEFGRCKLVCFTHNKHGKYATYQDIARLRCRGPKANYLGFGPYWDLVNKIFVEVEV